MEFYRRLGFVKTEPEQTVKGIRYTPMVYRL
ncbi:MAG: GNAT family N-acetyltransferase [Leptolinea sp.]|nr:GNAT family N-acetyltransferase [Leptolinea sp.]